MGVDCVLHWNRSRKRWQKQKIGVKMLRMVNSWWKKDQVQWNKHNMLFQVSILMPGRKTCWSARYSKKFGNRMVNQKVPICILFQWDNRNWSIYHRWCWCWFGMHDDNLWYNNDRLSGNTLRIFRSYGSRLSTAFYFRYWWSWISTL